MYRGSGVLSASGGLSGVVRQGGGARAAGNCGLPTSERRTAMAGRRRDRREQVVRGAEQTRSKHLTACSCIEDNSKHSARLAGAGEGVEPAAAA